MNGFLTSLSSLIHTIALFGGGLCSMGAAYQPPKPKCLIKKQTVPTNVLAPLKKQESIIHG